MTRQRRGVLPPLSRVAAQEEGEQREPTLFDHQELPNTTPTRALSLTPSSSLLPLRPSLTRVSHGLSSGRQADQATACVCSAAPAAASAQATTNVRALRLPPCQAPSTTDACRLRHSRPVLASRPDAGGGLPADEPMAAPICVLGRPDALHSPVRLALFCAQRHRRWLRPPHQRQFERPKRAQSRQLRRQPSRESTREPRRLESVLSSVHRRRQFREVRRRERGGVEGLLHYGDGLTFPFESRCSASVPDFAPRGKTRRRCPRWRGQEAGHVS